MTENENKSQVNIVALLILLLVVSLAFTTTFSLYSIYSTHNLNDKISQLDSERGQLKEQVDSLTEQLHEKNQAEIKLESVFYAIDDYISALERTAFVTSDGASGAYLKASNQGALERMQESMKAIFPDLTDNATVATFADLYFRK